jgi:DNA-binding MarR family transcriptional regulator
VTAEHAGATSLHSVTASAMRSDRTTITCSHQMITVSCRGGDIDRTNGFLSLVALNTGALTAFARSPADQIRADAERLSHIILEMQRCFVLRLCKELAPGNVSFSQFFLLAYLDQKEVLTMSAIAKKMGHTTAAASGLVARLENLRYVVRSVARDDRRKVMVCITPKGSALVRRIREEMVGNLMKILDHLTPEEQKAWLQIYTKIYDYCQSK